MSASTFAVWWNACQALERVGRSALKDEMIPDDLLILSCEEDYEVCVPFLEKGAAVYSSALLLNGIVTQKLDYERSCEEDSFYNMAEKRWRQLYSCVKSQIAILFPIHCTIHFCFGYSMYIKWMF